MNQAVHSVKPSSCSCTNTNLTFSKALILLLYWYQPDKPNTVYLFIPLNVCIGRSRDSVPQTFRRWVRFTSSQRERGRRCWRTAATSICSDSTSSPGAPKITDGVRRWQEAVRVSCVPINRDTLIQELPFTDFSRSGRPKFEYRTLVVLTVGMLGSSQSVKRNHRI
jgi:hypothetical protein